MKRAISYLAAKYISDNLGQKVLRIMFEISYPQDDYQAFCSRYDPSPHPTLVNFVQSGSEMIHPDFSGGEAEGEYF